MGLCPARSHLPPTDESRVCPLCLVRIQSLPPLPRQSFHSASTHSPASLSLVAALYLVTGMGKWRCFTLGIPEPCSSVYNVVQKMISKPTLCIYSCLAVLQSAHVPEPAAMAAGPMSEKLHGCKLPEEQTLGLAHREGGRQIACHRAWLGPEQKEGFDVVLILLLIRYSRLALFLWFYYFPLSKDILDLVYTCKNLATPLESSDVISGSL